MADAAFIKGRIEFTPKNVEHGFGRGPGTRWWLSVEQKIDRIVTHPVDRNFHDARWCAVRNKLIAAVIRHQRAVIGKALFRDQFDGVCA